MRLRTGSFLAVFAALILAGGFVAGCGDDGGGPPPKCKTKLDPDKIVCHFGTISSGGSVVVGAEGATDPNAEITIEGKNDTTTTTADDKGGFARSFIAGNGETITVTATAPGCEPTSVQVVCTRE